MTDRLQPDHPLLLRHRREQLAGGARRRRAQGAWANARGCVWDVTRARGRAGAGTAAGSSAAEKRGTGAERGGAAAAARSGARSAETESAERELTAA